MSAHLTAFVASSSFLSPQFRSSFVTTRHVVPLSSSSSSSSPTRPSTCIKFSTSSPLPSRRLITPFMQSTGGSTGGSNPPPPSSGGRGGGTGGAPEPPDGATLTQALELSFRNVWIRLLSSGVGKEYSDAIIAFVVSTMAAYKAGYSINALKLELATNEKTNTTYMGRDVALTDQEKQTRLIWISLVYLTLSKTKLVTERKVPSLRSELQGTELEPMLSGLTALVDSVFEAERKGYSLETFKMELAMKKDVGETESITQAQANIRSQWSRIVFSTLGLLPDSLKR